MIFKNESTLLDTLSLAIRCLCQSDLHALEAQLRVQIQRRLSDNNRSKTVKLLCRVHGHLRDERNVDMTMAKVFNHPPPPPVPTPLRTSFVPGEDGDIKMHKSPILTAYLFVS
jgi:hypothetical protein